MSDDLTIQNLMSYLPSQRADIPPKIERLQPVHRDERANPMYRGAWQIVSAHAITLLELGVIDEGGFNAISRAIDAAAGGVADGGSPRQVVADLVDRVDSQVPGEFTGAIALGLAREEALATLVRLVWRDSILKTLDALLMFQAALIDLADAHTITIMPAFVGGRATQPTTFAHLLGGLMLPLRQAAGRLQAAWLSLNQSPMGAGMLAGEIIVPERERQASLLGFDGPIENTFVAVMTTEDFVAAAEAIAASIAPLRRFLGEMISWIRADPSSFMLAREWQTRPEPANPLLVIPEPIESLVQEIRGIEARCQSLVVQLREQHFGPVAGLTGELVEQGTVLADTTMSVFTATGRLLVEGVMINRAYLGNRAGRGYTTGGDLAPFLMQEEGLSPSAARAIASMVLGQLEERGLEVSGITQDMIDSAAMMTIGREIKVEMETLGRFLAPRRFLDRRQVLGSPAQGPTREWLAGERESLTRSRAWHAATEARVSHAITALTDTIASGATAADD